MALHPTSLATRIGQQRVLSSNASLLLCAVIAVFTIACPARSSDTASAALAFCQEADKPITLNPYRTMLNSDKTVLCFDGSIPKEPELGGFESLRDDGYFVVRSAGGDVAAAIEIANLIQRK